MNHRQQLRSRHNVNRSRKPLLRLVATLCLVVLVFVGLHDLTAHVAANGPTVESGVRGYCLDLHYDSTTPGNPVDSWSCNHSDAQVWSVGISAIEHDTTSCLSAEHDGTSSGTPIVIGTCDSSPGEVWLRDQQGFFNPHSGLCLSLPTGTTGQQLVLANCTNLSAVSEIWRPSMQPAVTCSGTEGQKVACQAIRAWTTWQSGSPDHETLLGAYTDGAPYEEWCADFVSYMYKVAGYPFTQGEADGWDENDANSIQNMGFTMHYPAQYTPKPGDIAYFDYDGGHVEVVVSGGATPTFVYGNSATVDPTTGNGEMEANTTTEDGDLGNLVYYLSPQ